MKTVYIVLIKTHTGLGAVARRITGYPYTHIAVSLDRSMEDFKAGRISDDVLRYKAGW